MYIFHTDTKEKKGVSVLPLWHFQPNIRVQCLPTSNFPHPGRHVDVSDHIVEHTPPVLARQRLQQINHLSTGHTKFCT